MDVFVKESLDVLDYNNNIVDSIFVSNDKRTAGYAYNITITEENTGYSDLKFEMPNRIITDDGDEIMNPKLKLLTPLVKLRYHREVYYIGEHSITVREPIGYGDVTTYIDKTYSNVYPDNVIEDYVMDYIVQPVDRKRDMLKISTAYTAMDYPRFNLSKKKVGLTIDDTIVTKKEWSLFENKPLDVAGTVKYQQWTKAMSTAFKVPTNQDIPTEWNPLTATEYPLIKDNIIKLMGDTAQWPYGILATSFYWPITETGRFRGILYKKGGFLVLNLYDFYNLTTEGIDPSLYVDRYSWEWSQLYELDSYLCPNNADNYLQYILSDTNWSVAQRFNEVTKKWEDDVDIVQVDIPNPAGSTVSTTKADHTCNISISNGNCYNAITEVCKGLQLYPIFDCVNRTVALRAFAGKNYGLAYSLGSNLSNNSTKADGEKVITKLYVSGGKDYNGDSNINIGTAERSYFKEFGGFYNSQNDASVKKEGYKWYIIDNSLTSANFNVKVYNPIEDKDTGYHYEERHDYLVNNFWNAGPNRTVRSYNGTAWVNGVDVYDSTGALVPNIKEINAYGTTLYVDTISGMQVEYDNGTVTWNPNEDEYISSRSPYGTNYILNLRWAYQNNWITKQQILELYQLELQIDTMNRKFYDKYIEDSVKTRQAYHDAVNNYDIAQDDFESTLHAMESKYYNVKNTPSEGTTYCFHRAPKGTFTKVDPAVGKRVHFIKLFHCYDCGATEPIAPTSSTSEPASKTKCTNCKSTNVSNECIRIPVFDEFTDLVGNEVGYEQTPYEGPRYNPHLKGYFLRLVMGLDRADYSDTKTPAADKTIEYYEKQVSLIQTITYRSSTDQNIGEYDYVLNGVYVRSTSGQIEVWNDAINEYISAYGKMLDYLREVNFYLKKIQELDEMYERWVNSMSILEDAIQDKFGDFLIEGNYKNDEQPYIGLLFNEGMEASDKFSVPEITYTLNVIDATGLVEYREPVVPRYLCSNCGYISNAFITECPRCEQTLIVREYDTYNDLVHMLHNVGQIVPKPGDYTTVYDEEMGMFGVPALITEIQRQLDNPYNNKIKLDTSYTDDEDLVGNIITATNTVLNNADIYARTAVLKKDGTIDGESMRSTLDNANADITIVGTNGNILLNGAGLRCTDPSDEHRAIKYTGTGVYSTTTLNSSGEPTMWEKMMSPSGINATYLRSGTIDTNKITIMSGLSGKAIIDENGLTVKKMATQVSHIMPFDSSKAKADSAYAAKWGNDNNIASFIGVDNDNNPLMYTQGFLVAKEGSNIANWITSDQGLYHLKNNTKDLWLSPGGISGTVNNITDAYAYYSNGNFGVTTNGKLVATGADLSGKIVITDTASQMNKGTIGGWTSSDNGLYKGTLVLSPSGGAVTGAVHDSGSRNDWALFMNGNFGVLTNGTAYMTNAHVKGAIYADSGTFNGTVYATDGSFKGTINTTNLNASGSVTIDDAKINKATLESCTIDAADIKSGTLASARIPSLDAKKIATGKLNADVINNTGLITTNNLSAQSITADQITSGTMDAARINSSSIMTCKQFIVYGEQNSTYMGADGSAILNLKALRTYEGNIGGTTGGRKLKLKDENGLTVLFEVQHGIIVNLTVQ